MATLQAGTVNVNLHSKETRSHRGPNRFQAAGLDGSATSLISVIETYFLAQVTSSSVLVDAPGDYGTAHTEGTDLSCKVIIRDADDHVFRIDFRNLATGVSYTDLVTAFTAEGLLLPNSGAQSSSASPTIRTLT